MELLALLRGCVGAWQDAVARVASDQWQFPTPCAAWDVRGLVHHVAWEDRWAIPLLEGRTIAEVGDSLDGDLLAATPAESSRAASDAMLALAAERIPLGGSVQLSAGDEDVAEYLRQLAADHLVHAWDLAVAAGQDSALDGDLVVAVAEWFADREPAYRASGAIGARGPWAQTAQERLLSAFGRDPRWGPNHAAVAAFGAAFGSGDVDAALAWCADDIVFEATSPAPDGTRHEGIAAVRRAWAEVLATPGLTFTEEETVVFGDRAVVCWRFAWGTADADRGHVRGVDVIRLRDGLVCEKLSYVKG